MKYVITVNGTSYEVEVTEVGGAPVAAPRSAAPVTAAPPVAAAPAPASAPAPAPKQEAPQASAQVGAGETVVAPMPGTILDVRVAPGTAVKSGAAVVILEAMKMQNEIVAPKDGTITSINVSKGETVKVGQVLFAIQ